LINTGNLGDGAYQNFPNDKRGPEKDENANEETHTNSPEFEEFFGRDSSVISGKDAAEYDVGNN
jgi:hypothetical protein